MRARLAAAVPAGLPAFLEAAARVRGEAGKRIPDDSARAKFWSEATERVFVSSPLSANEWEVLLRQWLQE